MVREAKMLQKVDHPNIIKCYDSWIENSEFYVALEVQGYLAHKKHPAPRTLQ